MPATGPARDANGEPPARGAGGSPALNPLQLDPDPGAAGAARAWVARALDGWPDERVETARLIVSELVTNAVLHAGTPISLRYQPDGDRARFEVCDERRAGPHPKRYSPDSPTGRGLRLVDVLAEDWGVTRATDGKFVWFVVDRESDRLDTRSVEPAGVDKISPRPAGRDEWPDARDVGRTGSSAPADPSPGTSRSAGMVPVEILALPLDVYLEAEQHNDAIMRELTLLLQSSESRAGLDVPQRLLDLAGEVRAMFGAASTALREQVERAIRSHQETVDIHMEVPAEGWEVLMRLATHLDEVDRFCEEGDLLTLGASPRLRRFRKWYATQVANQACGLPATPWPRGTGTPPN